jgi:hypothetical protein
MVKLEGGFISYSVINNITDGDSWVEHVSY